MQKVSELNIMRINPLPSPGQLIESIPCAEAQARFVAWSRAQIRDIISGKDDRLLLVVGPCSIHDVVSGMDYAKKLKELSDKVSDRILLVMRTYFEKPRTSMGWKGLIVDPHLDSTYDVPEGLRLAREFLSGIANLGLPAATEFLDPITPQYISDLISWTAIGSRTVESQTHRLIASGLSMPVGFKNGMDGHLDTAVNAINAASHAQTFLGINVDGQVSAINTRGNTDCHLVLRGGREGPNYSAQDVSAASALLIEKGLNPAIMIDCGHGNSGKEGSRQLGVCTEVLKQLADPDSKIIGLMLESNLLEGKQAFPQPKESLEPGLSITDPCISWSQTEALVEALHAILPYPIEIA